MLRVEFQQTLGVLGSLGLPIGAALGEDGVHLFGGLGLALHAHDGQLAVMHVDLDQVILLHQCDGAAHRSLRADMADDRAAACAGEAAIGNQSYAGSQLRVGADGFAGVEHLGHTAAAGAFVADEDGVTGLHLTVQHSGDARLLTVVGLGAQGGFKHILGAGGVLDLSLIHIFSVNKALQRADKVALSKIDPTQIYHIFPDQREGSSSALVLKKPKTKKSSRTLYLTRPLKEELLAWLEKLRQDELAMDGRYRNCGQLFRLPNGMPVAPEALSKWYRTWRAEHPEFEKIVFHGLRHSSATYQLIESGGNIKAVQGNTGHATATVLMDTYAHTQDRPRLELAEKLEADFYSQDIGSPKSGSVPVKENLPDSIQITPEGMLKVVRQMNPEQRREFTRLLFA